MLMMEMRMAGQRTLSDALCAAAPFRVVLKTIVLPISALTGVKIEALRYGQKRMTDELLASHSACAVAGGCKAQRQGAPWHQHAAQDDSWLHVATCAHACLAWSEPAVCHDSWRHPAECACQTQPPIR